MTTLFKKVNSSNLELPHRPIFLSDIENAKFKDVFS